jgi:hypothetical protein
MSPPTWFGLEIDLEPYLEEKEAQGLVWDYSPSPRLLPLSSPPLPAVIPSYTFQTHAGTFYKVLLPQIRQSRLTQTIQCKISTLRCREDGLWEYCDPYVRRDLPDDTVMSVAIELQHPKQ